MLIPVHELQRIADGRVSLVFRRWIKPTVKPGGTLRTAVGVLAIEAVDSIVESEITPPEARAAGYDDLEALRTVLNKRTEGSLFRIRLRLHGADPRSALRDQTALSQEEIRRVLSRLASLDKSSRHGSWTLATLSCISARPGCRAAELAALLGLEKDWLKVSIRKLKELGLTESLNVGYRLSPRGEAVLSRMRGGDA